MFRIQDLPKSIRWNFWIFTNSKLKPPTAATALLLCCSIAFCAAEQLTTTSKSRRDYLLSDKVWTSSDKFLIFSRDTISLNSVAKRVLADSFIRRSFVERTIKCLSWRGEINACGALHLRMRLMPLPSQSQSIDRPQWESALASQSENFPSRPYRRWP